MENASKALIIAGAILLSILIIAIGMYIYNSSSNSITNAASQISQQDIQAFNNQFTMYEGKQVGTNVKALITTLSAVCKENSEEKSRIPDLYVNPHGGDLADDGTILTDIGDDINLTGLNKARTAIEAKHYYYVKFNTCPNTGLIDCVIVEYEDGDLTSGDWPTGNDH